MEPEHSARAMTEPPRVVVVGGGHAGVEAALAAHRSGARVTLATLDPAAIGRMSCNPSIGGLAKGQIVREVDALGGILGRAADRSAIHFRMLNERKGPAVQSPRTQNDRERFSEAVQGAVEAAGIEVVAGEVADLVVIDGRVRGARLADGTELFADAVVLTTGTFLGGVLHVGQETTTGGRLGEGAAHALSQRLADLGVTLGRMKTGTPPRFFADSIDLERTTPQPSDPLSRGFAFLPQPLLERRVICSITRTTPESHAIIEQHLDESPMFSGRISGQGPRYCPSIEDKIFRFPERDAHQIFLEPEGLDSDLVYPNGISTSLPREAQEAFVRTVPGLEQVRFAAHGYAVEYDHVDPRQLGPDLQMHVLPGLYLAGQINGTTGYEEAAGQGLLAGVNAARGAQGRDPLVLGRHEAYLGVLVDDLTTRGVTEPYRMFTSLAEHRLLLRHHDADLRLLDRAEACGLLDAPQLAATRARRERRDQAREILMTTRVEGEPLFDLLRRPGRDWGWASEAASGLGALELDARDADELVMEARYAGYVERERRDIARQAEEEGFGLPADLDYANVAQLRHEAREKFTRVRPATLGQAARIAGISPADLATLRVHLRKVGLI